MNEQDKEELIKYRIKRAKETINEVDVHVKNELWNTAVNRIYYACYYAIIALFVKHNIKATTHAGVRHMFGLHFIKTEIIDKDLGKFYSDIFDKRQNADYDDFIDFTKEDVGDLVIPARALISKIDQLL